MTASLNLAKTLGLQPLDRLQLSNSASLVRYRDEAHFSRGKPPTDLDLPFWFYRRIVGDEIEVASPSGYIARVRATEICDILPGESISVMAMPKTEIIAWLDLTPKQRLELTEEDKLKAFYRTGKVIGALKGKFGYSFEVWFDDETLNIDRTTYNPLAQASQKLASSKAKSTIMPVTGGYGYSANKGVVCTHETRRSLVRAFFAATLSNQQDIKTKVLEVGDRAITRAAANRMLGMCNA